MMISKLRVLGVAVLGLFVWGLAYGQGAIVVNSGADFWNRLVPENSVYVDDAELASPQELNDLGAWLRGQNHHWEVIFLNRLNADSFVNQVSAGVNSDQNFLSLHDHATGEPDASLVVIGKSATWKPSDPHFLIRVYASPYLTHGGAGADSAFFKRTVLPEMKRLCNQEGPIAAAKYAVQTLPAGAVSSVRRPVYSSHAGAAPYYSGGSYPYPGPYPYRGSLMGPGMMQAMPSSPFEGMMFFIFMFGLICFVLLGLAAGARRRGVWHDDGTGYHYPTVITNSYPGGWNSPNPGVDMNTMNTGISSSSDPGGGFSGGGGGDAGGSWGGGNS